MYVHVRVRYTVHVHLSYNYALTISPPQELPVFRLIIESVFYDCPDITARITSPDINHNLSSFLQSTSSFKSQLLLLEEQTKLNGLTPMKNWIRKTEQVYIMSKTKHGEININVCSTCMCMLFIFVIH